MDDIAMAVGHDLEFDVVRLFHQLFHVHGAVAKAFQGLKGGCLEAGDKGGFIQHWAHASAAAAGAGLDDDGITNFAGPGEGFFFIGDEAFGTRSYGYASGTGGGTGHIFVSHHGNDAGAGANEFDFALLADIGEFGFFREEAVAGVDGIHVGNFGGADDAADLQVAFAARAWADADGLICEMDVHGIHVCFGINSNGFDVELFTGADDADGDLTTIGDEDFAKHAGLQERKFADS